jgi:hypothetical protein
MSNILAQTATTLDADAAYSASGEWDRTPPSGVEINCLGLRREGSNPGTMGMIFEVNIPDGYILDARASGSLPNADDRNVYDHMWFSVMQSGGRAATQRWEIWFNESDVDSEDWNLPMQVNINANGGNTVYTYRFKKGGAGGGPGRR